MGRNMSRPRQGFWTSPERYIEFLESTGFSVEDVEILARDWNRALGMMGYELVEFAGYFYSPKLSFELKPPIPDLENRARQAIFWKNITSIRVTSEPDLKETLGIEGICLRDALGESFRKELLDRIGHDFWSILWKTLERFGFLKRRLEGQLMEDLYRAGFRGRLSDDLWHCLAGGVQVSIFYGAGFFFVGDDAKNFRPLLELYKSGNLPIGFNKQGELVFLCMLR